MVATTVSVVENLTIAELIEQTSTSSSTTRTVETLVADIMVDVLDDKTNKTEDLCPNNNFCFTKKDLLEARIDMNEATRHTGTYNSAWSKIRVLEGDNVVVKKL